MTSSGGVVGLRGHFIQAFVCLLRSVDRRWDFVEYEPEDQGAIVDIKWTFADKHIEHTQVTHSQDQIAKEKYIDSMRRLAASSAKTKTLIIVGTWRILPSRLQNKWNSELKKEGIDTTQIQVQPIAYPELNLDYLIFDCLLKRYKADAALANLPLGVLVRGIDELAKRFLEDGARSDGTPHAVSLGDFEMRLQKAFGTSAGEWTAPLQRELAEIEEFKAAFGYEARREMRRKIMMFYITNPALDRRDITMCREFFWLDPRSGDLQFKLRKIDWFRLLIFAVPMLTYLCLLVYVLFVNGTDHPWLRLGLVTLLLGLVFVCFWNVAPFGRYLTAYSRLRSARVSG